ncbi:MAG: hypothetical protein EAZ60_27210 [Oscillatoriales cyanobacterium]|nr:MAG: hypothetical protein EAZ83_30385 [Oscillatoriales cyanobacterium]TAE96396.1 MAG: hypothetical protein EAZ79_14990 [Oscillatoriales cyanobacterium]TAF13680.1 MAG: hypothetical protein EAZ73_30170 [Oscillatoriales cyanobacterium]TAF32168.1 MAG: hypothetical protein EAZ69_18365 [Oscillatoriales cyanobacterium]TAF51031.1 MAG: hypothetical protein EAZ60_27210 [Oscillatoriales cyanobacterium]
MTNYLNPPPPHRSIQELIEFNDEAGIVYRGDRLGGGGLIEIIGGGLNSSVNPPLQIFFKILLGILSHILPSL